MKIPIIITTQSLQTLQPCAGKARFFRRRSGAFAPLPVCRFLRHTSIIGRAVQNGNGRRKAQKRRILLNVFAPWSGGKEKRAVHKPPWCGILLSRSLRGRYARMAMELVWLGQGGFLIRCGGASICLDPYLSDSCERSGGHTRIAPAPLDPASIWTTWTRGRCAKST